MPEAHPRSRGENLVSVTALLTAMGSSPLTRGKPFVVGAAGFGPGLIPAHAGKTHWPTRELVYSGAHPRSRGENNQSNRHEMPVGGSSPLTRGKLHVEVMGVALDGLIPAHAGKTRRQRSRSHRPRAHPRSRGENSKENPAPPKAAGSSPLTRGKLGPSRARRRVRGLIPAHAGKTSEAIRRSCLIWAHPRSRGENT